MEWVIGGFVVLIVLGAIFKPSLLGDNYPVRIATITLACL